MSADGPFQTRQAIRDGAACEGHADVPTGTEFTPQANNGDSFAPLRAGSGGNDALAITFSVIDFPIQISLLC